MFRIVQKSIRHASRTGRLNPNNTAIFLCDMQDRFKTNIYKFDEIVETSRRLFEISKILEMPIIVTEHAPKIMGHTVETLGDVSPYIIDPSKTQFSMITPKVETHLNSLENIENAIIVGIETHACVMATTFDLIERDISVHLPTNAISSRTQVDRIGGLQRCKQAGAYLTTAESLVFQLTGDAKHPKFKQIAPIIRESMLESDADKCF